MSRPKNVEAHLLSLKEELGHLSQGGEAREVSRGRVKQGSCSWRQRRRSFGWKHPKANLSWRKLILGLEEEEEGDFEKRNGFHLSSSPIFLPFLIFYDCISPLYELIPFSRVLDVI